MTSSLLSVLLRTTLEFTAFGSGPDAKPNWASAFWFFKSTTMVFAAVRTHVPRKNTRVYSNLRNSRNIESSRRRSLEFAAFGNASDVKHSTARAFRYFLSTTMVSAAVRTQFPKKNTRVYVNRAAINKQLFKYLNEILIWHRSCVLLSTLPFDSSGSAARWFDSQKEQSFFFGGGGGWGVVTLKNE